MYNDTYPSLWYHTEYFHCPKSSVLCLPPTPKHLATTDPFVVLIVLSFPECYRVGIIQDVTFSNWLLSLPSRHLSFFHVFSWLDSCSFLVLNNFIVWMYSLFILSPTEGHLGCFQVWQIMSKAAIQIRVHVFVWTYIFKFFE